MKKYETYNDFSVFMYRKHALILDILKAIPFIGIILFLIMVALYFDMREKKYIKIVGGK